MTCAACRDGAVRHGHQGADVREQTQEAHSAGFRDSGSAFKEQGATGLRFYPCIKTAAVRYAW